MENARLYEQAEQTAIAGERSRLARELHDAVTQTLFSASLIADVLPPHLERDPEEGVQNLEKAAPADAWRPGRDAHHAARDAP